MFSGNDNTVQIIALPHTPLLGGTPPPPKNPAVREARFWSYIVE